MPVNAPDGGTLMFLQTTKVTLMCRISRLVFLAFGLTALLLAGPAAACGPSQPFTSEELLQYQTGIIERGLKRENLSDAQKAQIAVLRGEVEAAHKADKRADARAAMEKIVAMFQTKELFGAVEPIVPGCGPSRPNVVTGTLTEIAIEPNRPGTRCGNHYVLTVKEDNKALKLFVYDLGKAPYDRLKVMLGKKIEADTLGGTAVTAVRLAGGKPDTVASLAGLSATKPC